MFDAVRNNQKIVQGVLALIVLPFAFWGVESYVRGGGGSDQVATVGGAKISVNEFQRSLREQQDRLRPLLGSRDPALLDGPQIRRSVLDNLITQRLLLLNAAKSTLTVSNQRLAGFITSQPSLQENGKFSQERYDTFIAAQNMSKETFEARVRQDLIMQQPVMPVADGALPGTTAAGRWQAVQLEQREVSDASLRPEQYADKVKLAADAVKTFYEANRQQFETPQQARAEYIVLSQDKLADQMTVSDAEVKDWYQAHADRYQQAEERRASHILIRVPQGAPAADVKAAEAKAEQLLATLKKSPGEFAALAKQNSQDPGSAANGGDLGWFGRGAMTKPFEDAVFSLKENELSGLVRSDFGIHIVKLTGIKPAKAKSLDQVKPEIIAELKQQAAAKKYAELAEGFSNTVYEQADSLKPAAEKYKLTIQQTDWLSRNGKAPEPFANPKLMAAIFSDDAVKNKRNTEAVEVAPNTLVAARVLDYKPAAVQPLEAVARNIETLLTRQEAAKLAAADGEAKLAQLNKGEAVAVTWGAPRLISRAAPGALSPQAARAIFAAPTAKLPSYAGLATPGGYLLFRISQVKAAPAGGDGQAQAIRQQYERTVAEEEFSAWLAVLKARYPVEINQATLEAKQQ
ncbi:MAG TPA: SurA N-terminal domain-containing protein [Rhodocyclaceae bacterium]|nr:SurA N-terminal domain-containing protein [Rhodocyclaceae bacterium]